MKKIMKKVPAKALPNPDVKGLLWPIRATAKETTASNKKIIRMHPPIAGRVVVDKSSFPTGVEIGTKP